MASELDTILTTGDSRDRISQVQGLIDRAVQSSHVDSLKTLISRILSDDVPPQISRPVVLHFANQIRPLSPEHYEDVANHSLIVMKQCPINLDEANFVLRDQLCNYYIQTGQFSDAAQILAGVNVESTTRVFTEEEKVDIYIKCAEAYLEDEAAVEAEVFMNKASPYMNSITAWTLQLRYKATLARVLDANRKFAEAALKYYELSTLKHESLVTEELLELYVKSIVCTILSKSGVQRNRMLQILSNDPRFLDLEVSAKFNAHHIMVNKMTAEHIITADECKRFEEFLSDHHKVLGVGGESLLERGVREHNVLSISKLYCNIYFSELGRLLNVDENRAEKIVATMISEGRLRGRIDQVEGGVLFEDGSKEGVGLADINSQIQSICQDVNAFVDLAKEVFPDIQ
eukprot:gene28426-34317_t